MAGQDWLEKDFYKTLGVSSDASQDDVRKAYRKLARTLHPDANPGDASAEARFKEVGEAYSVLNDPEQRQQYDAVRAMAGGRARFTSGAAGPSGPGGAAGFEDLFGGLFGGAGGAQRVRYGAPGGAGAAGAGPDVEDLLASMFSGAAGRGGPAGFQAPPGAGGRRTGVDLEAETTLPFADAVGGATVTLSVDGQPLTTRVPPGVRDGQRIRLRGKGRPGPRGGDPGDLFITVHVEPHPVFTRDGDDLRLTLPITFDEAALGAEVTAPTLDGGTVRLKVPAGTPSGRTLRVKGRGVRRGDNSGDLLVTTQVVVPQRLDSAARAAVEAFRAAVSGADGADPRADLLARARGAAGGR
ncbi:molecular chaperone DnaJ [Quadrisphaera granulorum]|uniref:Molecular chaperone DnaJ n=1 Tax=Quadrisphaera granulorum TaxID=317664 RepID=A0A316ADM0_9ACTN|nr:DnaJ C-terminal domain-containing protein [Quadrisphaera granulorum]PWJ55855.1 molecular chaperone DnaJ [Quadrisphaera granulorum]SZE95352.1 molecular chaperone DnaJ [Quadrisphaera granulorum]